MYVFKVQGLGLRIFWLEGLWDFKVWDYGLGVGSGSRV